MAEGLGKKRYSSHAFTPARQTEQDTRDTDDRTDHAIQGRLDLEPLLILLDHRLRRACDIDLGLLRNGLQTNAPCGDHFAAPKLGKQIQYLITELITRCLIDRLDIACKEQKILAFAAKGLVINLDTRQFDDILLIDKYRIGKRMREELKELLRPDLLDQEVCCDLTDIADTRHACYEDRCIELRP